MKKTISFFAAMGFAVCANASVYFFSPSGAGDNDGSDWENAAPAEYLGDALSEAEAGDTLYLMEGAYAPSRTTNRWLIPQGVVLKGGYPTTMTGTNTSYNYANGGQSVFSADLDGDGKGDNTDYAFVYIGEGEPTEKSEAYYDSWTLTEVWGITFRDGMRLNSKYWGNMVFVQAAKVDFHYCQFLNNDSQTNDDSNGSNGAVQIWGSQVRCYDCIFRDNITAKGSGAAFQVRARKSNSSTTDPKDYSIAYFERCEFNNNIAYSTLTSAPGAEKWGTYGGNGSVSDNGGTVYMINCTVAGNKAWYRGVGIRVSTNAKAYFINNTFYDNPCRSRSSRGSNNGAAISAGDNSVCYFANNIMVEYAANDDFTSTDAEIFIQNANAKTYSAGYNVMGTITDNSGTVASWPNSDKYPTSAETVYTIEKVFGTNALSDNGGWSRTIIPTMEVSGMVVADMQTSVSAWPLDECAKGMDLTVDQRGYKRAATTMSGAYDANGTAPTEPEEPENPGEPENPDEPENPEEGIAEVNATLDVQAPAYNVLGQQVDPANYQGIVLQNGVKFCLQ